MDYNFQDYYSRRFGDNTPSPNLCQNKFIYRSKYDYVIITWWHEALYWKLELQPTVA